MTHLPYLPLTSALPAYFSRCETMSSTVVLLSSSLNSLCAFSTALKQSVFQVIRYTIADAFTTVNVYDVVTTAAVVMDFKAGGKGVAVGKVSEFDNTFEVSEKWDMKVYGKLLKAFVVDSIYPVGSIYMSVNSTSPATLFGGTWSQLKDRFLLGAGDTYSNGATGGAATVTEEAAEVFAKNSVLLLGNESQTVGPEDTPMKVHNILLGAGVVLLEGIRLGGVPAGKYLLSAAPLNLGGCDGAPCRAVLVEI